MKHRIVDFGVSLSGWPQRAFIVTATGNDLDDLTAVAQYLTENLDDLLAEVEIDGSRMFPIYLELAGKSVFPEKALWSAVVGLSPKADQLVFKYVNELCGLVERRSGPGICSTVVSKIPLGR